MTPEAHTPAFYKMRALQAMNIREGDAWMTGYANVMLTRLKQQNKIKARQVAVEKTQVHESLAPEALGRRLV